MLIREFRIEDYTRVVTLWKEAGLVLRPGDELDDIKLKLQRDPDLFLIAEEEHEIVGVVMGAWDGRRGWIYHLAVKPAHQRRGIANALIAELEKRLTAKGARKVNAQVYQGNRNSLEFFKARGYKIHSDLIMIGKHLKN
jgi:ribosomal protein S18 acetylase RimI-like enzyme